MGRSTGIATWRALGYLSGLLACTIVQPTKTGTLSLVRYTGREEVHACTRPLTHASVFSRKGG